MGPFKSEVKPVGNDVNANEPIGATSDTSASARTGSARTGSAQDGSARDIGTRSIAGDTRGNASGAAQAKAKKDSESKKTKAAPAQVEISQEPGVKTTRGEDKESVQTAAALEFDAIQTAGLLLAVVNTFAVVYAGPTCEMNDAERATIEPPLTRMIKKYGVNHETISRFSDPILLLAGVAMWGSRVSAIRKDQNKMPGVVENMTAEPDLIKLEMPAENGKKPVDIGAMTSAPIEYHQMMSAQ